jgi:glucokinase
MLLAGDVGGTKTLLGLFERAIPRPRLVVVHTYPTNQFASFDAILQAFARDVGGPPVVDAMAAGVAGPVIGGVGRLTNIIWDISCGHISERLKTSHVQLLNDLEAMALGAGVLAPGETVALQPGVNGRLTAMASEGGHADFAARTDRELAFVRMLTDLYGRAEIEHVLSGPGLLNLHRFTHEGRACDAISGDGTLDLPAMVSRQALEGTCPQCVEALSMFIDAYGAEAGNLALRGLATSGVFVGGGIAPKILPALQDGRFIQAFRAKGTFAEFASRVPVKVIMTPETGLVGAAVAAQELLPAT